MTLKLRHNGFGTAGYGLDVDTNFSIMEDLHSNAGGNFLDTANTHVG